MYNKRRLFWFWGLFLAAGAGWGSLNFFHLLPTETFTVCLFKQITSFPCPACGSTRAVEKVLHGELGNAIMINPLGILTTGLVVFLSICFLMDLIFKRDSFVPCVSQIEKALKKPVVYLPFFMLLLVNWGWNISKDM